MELLRFYYLSAVVDEGSFTAAARTLHMAQPSLSQQVARLECDAGVQLLARTPRGVSLTASGRAFLPHALQALAEADRVRTSAAGLLTAAPDRLVVGFVGSAGIDLLPVMVNAFQVALPTATIRLRELDFVQSGDLAATGVDVAFLRMCTTAPGHGLRILREEPRVAILPVGHALAGRTEILMGELGAEPFITKPREANPHWRGRWLAEQRRFGLPGTIGAEVRTVQEGLNLVAAGQGVWLVPSAAATTYVRPDIVFVPVADDIEPAVLSVTWPIAGANDLTEWFVRTAVRTASSPGASAPDDAGDVPGPSGGPADVGAYGSHGSPGRPVLALAELSAVDSVVRHGGFTRAAAATGVSQQTLSGRITRLESQLGLSLLRKGRRCLPTEAGLLLLGPARAAVRSAEAATRAAQLALSA